MTITGAQLGTVLLSALLSGLVSYIVSNINFRRFEKRKMKTETLKRIAAQRYVLTNVETFPKNEEFFGALNEVFVVFQDAPEVISALETAHKNIGPNFNDYFLRLFKLMCDDLGMDRSQLNDSFFLAPFTPNASAPPGGRG